MKYCRLLSVFLLFTFVQCCSFAQDTTKQSGAMENFINRMAEKRNAVTKFEYMMEGNFDVPKGGYNQMLLDMAIDDFNAHNHLTTIPKDDYSCNVNFIIKFDLSSNSVRVGERKCLFDLSDMIFYQRLSYTLFDGRNYQVLTDRNMNKEIGNLFFDYYPDITLRHEHAPPVVFPQIMLPVFWSHGLCFLQDIEYLTPKSTMADISPDHFFEKDTEDSTSIEAPCITLIKYADSQKRSFFEYKVKPDEDYLVSEFRFLEDGILLVETEINNALVEKKWMPSSWQTTSYHSTGHIHERTSITTIKRNLEPVFCEEDFHIEPSKDMIVSDILQDTRSLPSPISNSTKIFRYVCTLIGILLVLVSLFLSIAQKNKKEL